MWTIGIVVIVLVAALAAYAARLALDRMRLRHEETASKRTHDLERERMHSQMTIDSMRLMLENQPSDPAVGRAVSATLMFSMLPESERRAALEGFWLERGTHVAMRPHIYPMTPSIQQEEGEPPSPSSGEHH
jgi:uncharacterized glyoxalase superfamily protein PhnB